MIPHYDLTIQDNAYRPLLRVYQAINLGILTISSFGVLQPPKRVGIFSTPISLATREDDDVANTLGERRGSTDRLRLRNPLLRIPLAKTDCLATFKEDATPPKSSNGYAAAIEASSTGKGSTPFDHCRDLVSLSISILIATTNFATKFSSKCTALPSPVMSTLDIVASISIRNFCTNLVYIPSKRVDQPRSLALLI
jgi:hypothetical protein